MASKIINQEGTMCDAEGCEKFFFGERPKSWRYVIVSNEDGTSDAFDACSVKDAKIVRDKHATITATPL